MRSRRDRWGAGRHERRMRCGSAAGRSRHILPGAASVERVGGALRRRSSGGSRGLRRGENELGLL